nr:hypothetical protein [Tanacetum cinerariifolium]
MQTRSTRGSDAKCRLHYITITSYRSGPETKKSKEKDEMDQDGLELPIMRGENFKKSATWQKGYFYYKSCNRRVDFPMLRYRLELDVSDNTAQTVVVMFDEAATTLVGSSIGSLMDIKDKLRLDVTGIIIVMIGRVWDVSVVSDQYLSTNFVLSDSKSYTIGSLREVLVEKKAKQDQDGLKLPIMRGENFKKSATWQKESLDCHVSLPPAISNLISTIQVMEIKSHSYYKYGSFESFTCWQINPTEGC